MNSKRYRVIFSRHLGQRVVVAENVVSRRGSGTATGGRRRRASVLALLTLPALLQGAFAAPTGGSVVAGSAGITQSGVLTTIQQSSQRAIINWQSFGIGRGESVRIAAPDAHSATLNRVTGNVGSRIDGSLIGNGRVFLVNSNGIVVGKDGLVNVNGGFVASTQNVGDAAFMAGGALNFQGDNAGKVQILGTVKSDRGDITIIAPRTEVGAGAQLQAGGAIQLVAASEVTLSNGEFSVAPKVGDAGQITTAGALEAAKVQLAAVNGNLGALAINAGGTLRATGTQQNPDGSISLVASGAGGNVTLSGASLTAKQATGAGGKIVIQGDAQNGTAIVGNSSLDASSASSTGGKIDVTAQHTGLTGETTVNTSGATQGGVIRVGGGFQGKDSDLGNAEATYVGPGVALKADGTQGDAQGGKVVVWADGTTRFGGALSARGHGTGRGGDAEVSGKTTLVFDPKSTDLRGGDAGGQVGTLLLDPTDVIISNAVTTDSGFVVPNFDAADGVSKISGATLRTTLATSDVTIDSSGGTGGNGDITFQGSPLDVTNAAAHTLTLKAVRDINFDTTLMLSGQVLKSLYAYAGRNISWNADTAANNIYAYAKRNINVNVALTGKYFTELSAGTTYNSDGSVNYSSWMSGTASGAINFGSAGTVRGSSDVRLYSGVNPDTSARSDFSVSKVALMPSANLWLQGFKQLNVDQDVTTKTFIASARDVDFSASKVASANTSIWAASYDSGNNAVSCNPACRRNEYGTITFSNPNVEFSNKTQLSLTSGLGSNNSNGYANNGRTDIPSTVKFNTDHVGSFTLDGFRDVTLDEAISAENITVYGRNINIQGNLSGSSTLSLYAAAYDAGGTKPHTFVPEGWQTQQGVLNIAPKLTLSSQYFYLNSGIDPANATAVGGRVDLPSSVVLQPANGLAGKLELHGFRDVVYPTALAKVTVNIDIVARNITVPSEVTSLSAGNLLYLRAGSFYNTVGASNINAINSLVGAAAQGDGWLSLPAKLTVDAPYIVLTSSVQSPANSTRTTASFASIQSDAAVSQTKTNQYLILRGFGDVSLPTISHKSAFNSSDTSKILVLADNITLNGDLTSSLINLSTGQYDTKTAGSGDGSRFTFKNNPVLYGGTYAAGTLTYIPYSIYLDAGANNVKPLTGVSFGYMDGVSPYAYFSLLNFNGTNVTMKGGADLAVSHPTEASDAIFQIAQVANATGDVVLNSNVTLSQPEMTAKEIARIKLAGGGLRMGTKVLSAQDKIVALSRLQASTRNAALNVDAAQLNFDSGYGATSTGQTVVNAANNLILNDAISTQTTPHSLEVNARGEITVAAIEARSGNASLTLRGDAAYGRTLKQSDSAGTLVDQDLNALFTNRGVYGEAGADGLGAVTVAAATPISVTPIFHQTMVAETDFTINVANTFFTFDGTAYASGATIPKGTVLAMKKDYSLGGNATALRALDSVTSNGVPLRNAYKVNIGGYTLASTEGNLFYDAAGNALATGTTLTTGTVVYVKPGYSLSGKNLYASTSDIGSGSALYTVGGYNAAAAGATVPNYTSKGTSYSTGNTWWNKAVSANSVSAASTLLSVDMAMVDTSQAANYYGNPISGTSTALNMSGQFYTLGAGNQATPSKLNALALGSGNNSTSGLGWDTGYGSATLQTDAGDLKVFSGARHAIAGAGFNAGDAADLNIYANPAATTFGYTGTVRDGAVKLVTGSGDLVALGYRDVNIEPSGTLTSGGNVTLGAARDLNINANVNLGGTGKLATLIAGNEINSGSNTISGKTVGTGDLLLVAGHGVNVNTDVARIGGGLQDAPTLTGVLAGGVNTADGLFKVTNASALTVGGALTNTEVPNVQFASTGIVYPSATTALSRDGVSTTAGTGNIDILTTKGNLTVAGGGVSSTVGGEISLKTAAANADVNLDGNVTTSGNVFVEAGHDIVQSDTTKKTSADKAVLTAGHSIGPTGTAAVSLRTAVNQLAVVGGKNTTEASEINIKEADALTLAGVMNNSGGANNNKINIEMLGEASMTVGTVTANPTTGRAAGTSTTGLTGLTGVGNTDISLDAPGAISSTNTIVLGATVRSDTGRILVSGGSILDAITGDLTSGADDRNSTKLNIATAGNVFLGALNIGSTGSGTPDALEIWSGDIFSSLSYGRPAYTGTYTGTYVNLLDTGGGTKIATTHSAHNLDVRSVASTTVGTGDLVVISDVLSRTSGYRRLAADRNVTLNANSTIDADGSGDLVITAGLGGSGSITQAAGGAFTSVTSGTGEINLRAADDITLSADITTSGKLLIQAVNGAITQNGGVLSADKAALTAGSSIGTSDQRVQTAVNQLAVNAGGNAYVTEADALTLAAKSGNNGNVDVQTTAGTLTVGGVAVSSGVTASTGGVTTLAAGLTQSGVAANGSGKVNLAAGGASSDVQLDRSVTSGNGQVTLVAGKDVIFNTDGGTAGTSAYAGTSATVSVTAGGNISNASGTGGADQEQIRAARAELQAGANIGSGTIDNTLTGAGNSADFNLNVQQLVANATGGNAVLWNRGAVNLDGNSGAKNSFGINAGDTITQSAGTRLSAVSAEFDTMRNASIGKVALVNTGDLNIGGTNVAGGDFSASSQNGAITQSGTLNANGKVTLNGSTITLTGTVYQSGHLVQNGVITNTGGVQVAALAISGNTATVTAFGHGANFDLGSVLTPSVLAGLPASVTTILVKLGNQVTSYSVAALDNTAIALEGSNAISGGWTVRTGAGAVGNPTTQARSYHLVDASGALNLGSKDVVIDAARGTAYAAGTQASSVAAGASTANTGAGFDATQGSKVTLTQTQTSGKWSVRDAYDATIDSPGNVDLAYLKANNNAVVVAGAANNGNLTVNGEVRTGGHLIGVAGQDVTLNTTADMLSGGRLTLVADETAGTAIGNGWLRNNGALQVASATNDIALYAVAGTAPAGYTATHASQVVLGGIGGLSETQPAAQWNTAYRTQTGGSTGWQGYAADGNAYVAGAGAFDGPVLWYKAALTTTPTNPTATPRGLPLDLPIRRAIHNPVPNTPLIGGVTSGAEAGTLLAALESGGSLDAFLEATASGPCDLVGVERVGRMPNQQTGYDFAETRVGYDFGQLRLVATQGSGELQEARRARCNTDDDWLQLNARL